MHNPGYDIDFVLIWVDGSDLEWQRSKSKYRGDEAEYYGHVKNFSIKYDDVLTCNISNLSEIFDF